jgi:hypothetical protein
LSPNLSDYPSEMAPSTSGFDDYLVLLERIHAQTLPRSYVEIGIRDGRSLALALPGTRIVGIDPAFSLHHIVDRKAQCFAEKSDDFFANHDLRAMLGDLPVDLAFVDGMHRFEFALRDFANLERNAGPDSVILVHDCNPPTRESANPKQDTYLWAGDVWKLLVCLAAERPDLDVSVVDVAPTGLAIIRSLDPSSNVLFDRQDEIIERYRALDFSVFEAARTDSIDLVPNQWDTVRALLPTSSFRKGDPNRLRRLRSAQTFWAKVRRRFGAKLKSPSVAA